MQGGRAVEYHVDSWSSSTHWHSRVGEASPEGAVTAIGLCIIQLCNEMGIAVSNRSTMAVWSLEYLRVTVAKASSVKETLKAIGIFVPSD